MAKTMFEMGQWTSAESWRTIRSMRAAPPSNLGAELRGDRKAVFHMALEQSQQLFDAASKIGYESRPLPLFYGLSQAGRAISAASSLLSPHNGDSPRPTWQGVSHGLEFHTPLDSSRDFWESSVIVRSTFKDSFSRTSLALGSPTDQGEVEIGAAVSQLVEFVHEFRDFGRWRKFLDFNSDLSSTNGKLTDSHELRLTHFEGSATQATVKEYIAGFPALVGLKIKLNDDGTVFTDNAGTPVLVIPKAQLVLEAGTVRLRAAHRYRRAYIASRAVGTSTDATHPLMSWWLVLFSLSMIARYAPKDWARVLDISTSPVASQIEFLQDAALTSVPHLVAESLERLNTDWA